MRFRLAAAAVLTLAAAGTAGAATPPPTTYVDASGGFRITLPHGWYYVPSSVAGVEAEVRKLDHEKQTGLAKAYDQLIATAAARAAIATYAFQAFVYPPLSTVETVVTVGVVHTSASTAAKQLPALGRTFAKEFATTKGAKVDPAEVVTLGSGPAALVEGSDPLPHGLAEGFELYLIPHGTRLYELGFRIDARLLPRASAFRAIANGFSF
jgi:hypothetical protein